MVSTPSVFVSMVQDITYAYSGSRLDAIRLNPTPNPSPRAGRGAKAQLWRGGVSTVLNTT
jgi:hypothetical protein